MDPKQNFITFIFKIKYETNPGEEVYILGEHRDFGNWHKAKFKLKWTEGHIWQAEYNFLTSIDYIPFKFVCISKSFKKWEDGENRLLSAKNLVGLEKTYDGKYILNCIWNHFKLTFNIHYKIIDKYSQMRIVGSPDALANWQGDSDKSVIMKWDKNKKLIGKDGNLAQGFWTVTVLMKNDERINYNFDYRYIIFNKNMKSAMWERDPNRHLELITNINDINNCSNGLEDYKKILTNSYLEIIDINFVGELLFDRMGNKNIFIGPYPQSEEDLKKLSQKGINEIINLQTDDDIKARQIKIEILKYEAKKYGININRYPIEDYSHDIMVSRLKGASDLLYELLKKGKIVYVHCTAGMYRASSTVILYMVLYENYEVNDAVEFCSKYRPVICPNVRAINELSAIYKNKVNQNIIKNNGTAYKKKKIVKKIVKKI